MSAHFLAGARGVTKRSLHPWDGGGAHLRLLCWEALICVDLLRGAGMQMKAVASCCRSSRIYRNMQTPPHLKTRSSALPAKVLLLIFSLIFILWLILRTLDGRSFTSFLLLRIQGQSPPTQRLR